MKQGSKRDYRLRRLWHHPQFVLVYANAKPSSGSVRGEEHERMVELTLRFDEIPSGMPFSSMGHTSSSASTERVRRCANNPRGNWTRQGRACAKEPSLTYFHFRVQRQWLAIGRSLVLILAVLQVAADQFLKTHGEMSSEQCLGHGDGENLGQSGDVEPQFEDLKRASTVQPLR